MAPENAPGWSDHLSEGERVLWQGQPQTEISWARTKKRGLLIGIVIVLFYSYALLFPRSNVHAIQITFNVVMLIVGAGFAVDAIWGRAWRYRRTWYSITDRRVFIARDPLFGDRTLHTHPVGRSTQIKRTTMNPDHVWFSTRGKRARMVPLRDLADANGVERLLRDITTGETGPG